MSLLLPGQEEREIAAHPMRVIEPFPTIAPCEENLPDTDAPHAELTGPRSDEFLIALMTRFAEEGFEPGDVEALGRYLFDSLIGSSAWRRILAEAEEQDDDLIELALSWESDDYELHALSWEAMHDGEVFLGAHPRFSVAVTRVVADGPERECPAPVPSPARVLFVVGSGLDDPQIRPGAELVGLLRDLERGEGAAHAVVLESATLPELERECRGFNPHIIHFVSHGELDDEGRGKLQLQSSEDDDKGLVSADHLLNAMQQAERLPLLVVLTGCDSAAAGEHMDSLAAELVKAGIPSVIGMAGKISDPVCRLFSRTFGHAINQGRPLVQAMTEGRRAGLQRQEERAGDDHAWALPSIYLGPKVPAGHAPVDAVNAAAAFARMQKYELGADPIFCGRRDLVRLFDRLLDGSNPLNVLVAYSEAQEKLGTTRLLHEFAGRALLGGHVVVMIDDRTGDPTRLPSTPLELTVAMLSAIAETRQRFGLRAVFGSALIDLLERTTGRAAGLEGLPENLEESNLAMYLAQSRKAEVDQDIVAAGLPGALSADLSRLLADARADESLSLTPASRVIVVLGGLEYWTDVAELLCCDLFGSNGLGRKEESFPVFATCSMFRGVGKQLKRISLDARGTWVHYAPLAALAEPEDTLAYQWLLLHPRQSDEPGSAEVYTPQVNPPPGEPAWDVPFKRHIRGIPGNFAGAAFYAIATTLEERGILVAADDDDVLRGYAQVRGQG